MASLENKRFTIAEASQLTGVSAHLLRQWESRFPQLKPKRNRAARRFYTERDIEIARRIKYLLWHEKLTTEGARLRLSEELHGAGKPKTNTDAVQLIARIEHEILAMLDKLESRKKS